ncbi:MAG: hypothetical protein V4490_06985 [Pseudomonadota bacterium]
MKLLNQVELKAVVGGECAEDECCAMMLADDTHALEAAELVDALLSADADE